MGLYLYIGSFAEIIQTCCLPTGNVPLDTDLKTVTERQVLTGLIRKRDIPMI